MQSPPTDTLKRGVLLRGIYDEACRIHSPETAYALFHELGVGRQDVHSYLGYVISDYYQIYVDAMKRAAKRQQECAA